MAWHKEEDDTSFTPNTHIEVFPHISAILDQKRIEAVLLDEKHGHYWHLSGKLLEVILVISQSPCGKSFQDVRNHLGICTLLEDKSLQEALCGLEARGLVKIGTVKQEKVQQPSIRLIIQYAVLYLWYALLLRIIGWDLVWDIRSKQNIRYRELPPLDPPKNSSSLQMRENVMAAIRLASVFTWVRSDCVPSSLATYHLLRAMKYSPVLMIGANVVPFEPHMWVELDDYRLDTEVSEQSLTAFGAVSELSDRNRENVSES